MAKPAKKTTAKKAAKKTVKKVVKKAATRAVRSFAAASTGPDAIVDIPPRNTFNIGLHSASEATMLSVFGVPGAKTRDCSPATGTFKQRIVSRVDVGPFRVSGLDLAVRLLKAALAEAEEQLPDVVAALKNEGMLCVRHKRTNRNSFSNHSWGTAIDLFFGSRVVDQGVQKTHRGVLQLAPFLNRHGFHWGAGFTGTSVDSMHFELAEETIRNPPS